MNQFIATIVFYIVLIIVAVAGRVWALPLLNTDDAGITAPNSCQLEQSYTVRGESQSADMTPACNIGNQFELSLPVVIDEGEASYALQVKKPVIQTENAAVAASLTFQPEQNHQSEVWQLNVPVSFYLDDQYQLDLNAGFTHEDSKTEKAYGAAATYILNGMNAVTVEAFKSGDKEKGALQMVYHHQIIEDTLSLYASLGKERKAEEPIWFGLGLSWAFI